MMGQSTTSALSVCACVCERERARERERERDTERKMVGRQKGLECLKLYDESNEERKKRGMARNGGRE